MDIKELSIILKWCGQEFHLTDLNSEDTVALLKHEIYRKTQVRPERQKLLNLKYKSKFPTDDLKLAVFDMKTNFKLMMVGSLEKDISIVSRNDRKIKIDQKPYKNKIQETLSNDNVLNDLEQEDEDDIPMENREIYLSKINKRVREYEVNELNPPREGKKLLVLDIDYTLFDHRSAAESAVELTRPFLHEFLQDAYENFEIVIWSATSMKWIVEKMRLLGVASNPNYKIWFYLDSNAMITVHCAKRGIVEVKPLGVIWGKYPQYSSKNTIMFDDIRRNFLMNPQSGLRIRAFANAHLSRNKDRELLKLKRYLRKIAENCEDFNKLNHRKWETYNPDESE